MACRGCNIESYKAAGRFRRRKKAAHACLRCIGKSQRHLRLKRLAQPGFQRLQKQPVNALNSCYGAGGKMARRERRSGRM
jgi:hypothetical protein